MDWEALLWVWEGRPGRLGETSSALQPPRNRASLPACHVSEIVQCGSGVCPFVSPIPRFRGSDSDYIRSVRPAGPATRSSSALSTRANVESHDEQLSPARKGWGRHAAIDTRGPAGLLNPGNNNGLLIAAKWIRWKVEIENDGDGQERMEDQE